MGSIWPYTERVIVGTWIAFKKKLWNMHMSWAAWISKGQNELEWKIFVFSSLPCGAWYCSGNMKALGTQGYTQRNTDQPLKEKTETIHGERRCRRANRLFACGVRSRDSKSRACWFWGFWYRRRSFKMRTGKLEWPWYWRHRFWQSAYWFQSNSWMWMRSPWGSLWYKKKLWGQTGNTG